MNVFAARRALSPDQLAILNTRLVEGDHSPEAWLHLLTPLVQYARQAEGSRKKHGCLLYLAAAGGLLLFFFCLSGISSSNQGPDPASTRHVLVAAAILGLGLFIAAFAYLVALAKVSVPPEALERLKGFILPLLAILREDMGKAELHLKMDLRGAAIPEKQILQGNPYAAAPYSRIVATQFCDPWIAGRGALADGSRLEWQIEDKVVQWKKTKKSASGKTKIKIKQKAKTLLKVQVALPEGVYDISKSGAAGHHAGKMKIKPGEKRSTVKQQQVLKLSDPLSLKPEAFIRLVGQAYQHAIPAPHPGAKS